MMEKHNNSSDIRFVHGEEGGKAAWYVVQVSKVKLPIYERMISSNNYNLKSVGKIKHSGWGEEIPESIKKKYMN